jgi:hypothetical protein
MGGLDGMDDWISDHPATRNKEDKKNIQGRAANYILLERPWTSSIV